MATLSSSRFYPVIRACYTNLIQRGKEHRARVASEESLFKQEGVPDEDRDSSPLLRIGMTDCSKGELTHDH